MNYKNIYIFQTQLFVKYICCLLVFLSNSCPPFYSLLCICLRLASSVVMLQAHSRVVWLCSHLYLFFFKLSPCLGYYRTLSNPNPMSHSTPGLPVHHQLPESTQTHGHRVGDAHPTVSFSAAPFSSHLQSFPASESFPMSQLFASGGQSIRVSASTSVLPMNTQD